MQAVLLYLLAFVLAWPLGLYMAAVMRGEPSRLDRLFGPLERALYRLFGIHADTGMDWRAYAKALLVSNLVLGLVVWAVFMAQGHLPLNPDHIPGMSWDLALHTMASFLTNTNQQHYAGQAQLSYLSQTLAIVTLQFMTPMMGLAALVATLRAMFGGRRTDGRGEGEACDVGNYWVDMIRGTLRIFLPLALALSLLLAWQGVPSTYQGARQVTPLDAAAGMHVQTIPLGPVAEMVAIKQLGANGGGWYGPNSATPLENPTPLSDFLEMLSILLLPLACVVMSGRFVRRRGFMWLSLGVMAAFSVAMAVGARYSEQAPNAAGAALATPGALAQGPNMEGKEQRIGAADTALWSTLTTQVNNGSVNGMHDSLNPLAGLVAVSGMLIGAVWGGIGSGVLGLLVFLWITAFVCGLMTGRSPEAFGRKLETREIRLLSALLVLQPLLLLAMTALALGIPGLAGNSNPGFHGLSQVFYEYASAFANNGSGLEGLDDSSLWWNLSCVPVLLLGRFPALLIPLAVAASLGRKRVAPAGNGNLRVETPTFGFAMAAVIVLFTLLSFLPVLVLGPIGEWAQLAWTH